MTQEIELTKGRVALVDDEDFDRLNKYSWQAVKRGNTWYAQRNFCGKKVTMHRFILNFPSDEAIDHINRNGLDNRKQNLRACSFAENRRNSGVYKNNKTGLKGVHKAWWGNKYYAAIKLNGKYIHLGTHKTAEEAARAYDEAARKYHGEFAYTNFEK